MQLNRTGSPLTRDERINVNDNWQIIEQEFNNVVDTVSNKAYEQVVSAATLNWKEPVADFASLPSEATEGDTIMAKDTGKVYRYNGSAWQEIQQIDAGPVNEVDQRLSSQLDQTSLDLNSRGVNVLLNGVKGDGVTDDTQALQNIINENSYVIIPIPPVKYRITDEVILPSNRTIEFIGGNHWNPNSQREVGIIYDGIESLEKAMFRVSQSPVGEEPTADTSNVKFIGGCVLDGNYKISCGFYSAYVINESSFDKITAINTLKDGIQIEKSWYAVFRDLVAKGNQGNGITVGRNGWGGVNGCLFENIRGHSNGFDATFSESNYEAGYGVGLYLGSSSKVLNVVSERNYAAGLVVGMGTSDNHSIDTVYLEKNGLQAKADGKTNRNWGVIVKGSLTGTAKEINNLYLGGAGTEDVQSIWLREQGSKAPLEMRNVGGGSGGVIKAEWDNYRLTGMLGETLGTSIEGHLPKVHEGILNSNWTALYVRNTGSDDNNGRSTDTAFATLEKALEKAKSIRSITTIDCDGMNVTLATLDFKGLDRAITINGGTTAIIEGSSNNNNGLRITDASCVVNIINFTKISRLTCTNCFKVKSVDSNLGHIDGAFAGTVEVIDSNLFLDGCSLDGSQATNATKNGIRLFNSTLNALDLSISNYTTNRYFSLSEGSTINADTYVSTFEYTNWVDGSGFIQGGNRIRSATGTLTFS